MAKTTDTTTKAKAPASDAVAKKAAPAAKAQPKAPKATPVKTEPVAAPVAEPTPAEAPEADKKEEVSLKDMSTAFSAELSKYIAMGQAIKRSWAALESRQNREIKALQNQCKKKKKKGESTGGAPPTSGFTMPVRISPELAGYLGLDPAERYSRAECTCKLLAMIKEQNMQKEENRRHIIPTPALAKLLNKDDDKDLSYFNLQAYIAQHFEKKGTNKFSTPAAPAK